MRDVGDPGGREEPVRRVEHVPDGERVRDREDRLLRPGEQHVERGREPLGDRDAALAAARAERVGLVRPGPGAVVGERAPFERPEPDLVELRQDEPRDVAAAEREPERLLRPRETGRDAQPDRLVCERLAQRERLLDAQVATAPRPADSS